MAAAKRYTAEQIVAKVGNRVRLHPSVMVFVLRAGTSYELIFRSAGSPKALADFDPILRSLAAS